MTWRPFDWYGDAPLYYDIVFDAGSDDEAAFLEAVHDRHGGTTGRRMLEPACGSGRLLAACAQRGYRVTGFDASPAMLAMARKRLHGGGWRGRVFEARMERFAVAGRFDMAHCLVSTFKYLRTDADARAHLRGVARVLAPGGLYVVGLHLADYGNRSFTHERWVEARDGVEVTCNIRIRPACRRTRTERLRSRLTVRGDGPDKKLESHWTFRTYGPRQLARLVASVPAFEHVATYHFGLDLDEPIPLDGEMLDAVLVLRRR